MLLSKRSQPEKSMFCAIVSIWHSRKGKTMEAVKGSVVDMG